MQHNPGWPRARRDFCVEKNVEIENKSAFP